MNRRTTKTRIDQIRAWNSAVLSEKELLSEVDYLNKTIERVKELVIGAKANCKINMNFESKTTPHVGVAHRQLGEAIAILRDGLRQ